MENIFEKLVDILIAVVILFIFPILYFGQKQDTITQLVVTEKTSDFVDTVRTKGFVTQSMYDTYLKELDTTNVVYDIHLEHKELELEPEYRFKTLEEVIDDQNSSWNGNNVYTYIPVTTEIPTVIDPINNDGLTMNTDTNESVLAAAVDGPSDPNHIHTEACYTGHKHIKYTGFTHYHTHDSSCYYYKSSDVAIYDCETCGTHNSFTTAYYWLGELTGFNPVPYLYCDGCGRQYASPGVFISGVRIKNLYSWSCGYNMDLNGDESADNVGKVNQYAYQMGVPDDNGNSGIYTQGCYTLKFNRWQTKKDNPYADMYAMRDHPYNYFTDIPNSYTLAQRYRTGTNWENYVYHVVSVAYKPIMQVNGTTKFIKQSGNDFFPTEIDFSTLCRLYYEPDFSTYCKSLDPTLFPNGSTGYTFEYSTGAFDYYTWDYASGGPYNTWVATCGQVEDTTPDCGHIITSIIPTHPIQSVYINEPLITTATVQYKDGSSKIIVCSANFVPDIAVKNKTVTLTYYETIDGVKTGPYTCTIIVNVIPKTKICAFGHSYNLNSDGSDPGCPYCNNWLSSLIVFTPDSGEITIYKGTTLEENGVLLLATYLNGRREFLYSGYVNNLDKNYVGAQTVTISYKGKYTTLKVITKRNLKRCDVCGKYYELYPDGSDPGCPFCAALIPIFTGKVLKYYEKFYANEILKELYEGSGTYYFRAGDYLNIEISNKSATLGTKLLGFTLPNLPQTSIHVEYGGFIRDETQADSN